MKNRTQFILLNIVFSAFTAGVVLMLTYAANPSDSLQAYLFAVIYDVPLIAIVLAFVILMGMMYAEVVHSQLRSAVRNLLRRMEGILHVQKPDPPPNDNVPMIRELHDKLETIRTQLTRQQEAAQKLATERATAREKSLQEVVEQERSRLARELHDSVSQQLFAASMMMATINETGAQKDPAIQKQLEMVGRMVDQSQLEMRALLLHLRPVALKGKTLGEGLNELLLELKQKVPMTMEVKLEEIDLDKGIEDHLFRIAQEAISNTLRHAEAGKLSVILVLRDQNVIMRIRDDGKGFDMKSVRQHGSYGLENMRERAEEVGGSLKLISVPGEGTQLEVKVPIREVGV
ncbi:sensor histidine kinase [Salisediminibacterium beveridgei]|uniref:Sensor histidine kinase n=1 Tax=Salisediminibacterium beveridgei TaxID=632773 RepID=A0A1D7QTJ2_9BACI|nr:sensor histidine kinase [Salisediminibacterium beveridgei]AOM82342.1 Sensor histidine kinase VraS [Salisediminibacterium beveridgei]